MAKRDTKLESEGAEFLTLGELLINKIQSYKTYTNFPNYDLIATNPNENLSCRIQVKSRWATNYDKAFPIKNDDCDFVVHVALNRGFNKPRKNDDGIRPPLFYILPISIVRRARIPNSSWHKASLRNISNPEQYLDNWNLIKKFIKQKI